MRFAREGREERTGGGRREEGRGEVVAKRDVGYWAVGYGLRSAGRGLLRSIVNFISKEPDYLRCYLCGHLSSSLMPLKEIRITLIKKYHILIYLVKIFKINLFILGDQTLEEKETHRPMTPILLFNLFVTDYLPFYFCTDSSHKFSGWPAITRYNYFFHLNELIFLDSFV